MDKDEEKFEEHIRGKLIITKGGRTPKIETEVSVSLRLENAAQLTDIVLDKTKELLKGSLDRIGEIDEGEE